MSPDRRGILLAGIALVATLWLAITGQLLLYINPRYVVFTVIMAVLALGLVIASFARAAHSHAHDDTPSRSRKTLTAAATAVTLTIAVLMIVVPPATLSSATAIQRDIGASTAAAPTANTAHAASASNAAFEKFTVLDWSSLLRQTTDATFYQGKSAHVVGFVTADSGDPTNVFFVSRFVITCCAVDAQPVGVPVYLPNWKQKIRSDDWVRVTGEFTADPSRASTQQIALIPQTVATVAKPSQPYLF